MLDYFSMANELYLAAAVEIANIDLTEFSWNFKKFSHNFRHFIQFCVLKVQQRKILLLNTTRREKCSHLENIIEDFNLILMGDFTLGKN